MKNKKEKKEQGQLTIFMGISLMLIITMLAFVINVGLFVKAKINLQNAVDSAAWAGASVQARHLTNIAYANWEMRNVFKRWMFKYYVVGQTSLKKDVVGNHMSFKLHPFNFQGATQQQGAGGVKNDEADVPTVCIDFTGNHIVCNIFTIPGLPRFGAHGSPTIDTHYNASLNVLVKNKAADCASRSGLNFMSASEWAYGTGNGGLYGTNTPSIATSTVGAWPRAMELALRIRNLESFVNQPPYGTVCLSGNGCTSISEIESKEPKFPPYNERTIKAFYSGMKNLGGGDSDDILTFKRSFKLTELSVTPFDSAGTLSGYLIPESNSYRSKYYLDLQAMPVNYVTFFTAFVIDESHLDGQDNVKVEASCQGTKMGIPVPGYMMGFVKNPAILTYYAVKGEADFVGLFYPFKKKGGITLTAYAAAKPYGGRIGPKLFNVEGNALKARADQESKSAHYVTSLQGSGGYEPGKPIPTGGSGFWANSTSDILGGTPSSGGGSPKFVVPNLIFEYGNTGAQATGTYVHSTGNIQNIGLYNPVQWGSFSNKLGATGGAGVTGTNITQGLDSVTAPTLYDAMNYLIPTKNDDPLGEASGPVNSTSAVTLNSDSDNYQMYAPLYGEYTLFPKLEDMTKVINDILEANKGAIDNFMKELANVAEAIRKIPNTKGDLYDEAAGTIYLAPDPSCTSLAGKFNALFNGGCGLAGLSERYTTYWFSKKGANSGFSDYYNARYFSNQYSNKTLMTAFMPGTREGASGDGIMSHPFGMAGSNPVSMRRNFYSTKFVALDRLTYNGAHKYENGRLFMERGDQATSQDINASVINTIAPTELKEFGDDLKF